MSTIDTAWFQGRIRDRELSQRALATQIDMDHAALSLMLNGKRKMTVHEAGDLALALDVPLAEIMRRAGVAVRMSEQPVKITARITAESRLHEETFDRNVGRPADMAASVRAAIVTAPDSPLHSTVLLFEPTRGLAPDAVGRLCVVQLKGEDRVPYVGMIGRGDSAGRYGLALLLGGHLRDADIAVAAPIQWLRA